MRSGVGSPTDSYGEMDRTPAIIVAAARYASAGRDRDGQLDPADGHDCKNRATHLGWHGFGSIAPAVPRKQFGVAHGVETAGSPSAVRIALAAKR